MLRYKATAQSGLLESARTTEVQRPIQSECTLAHPHSLSLGGPCPAWGQKRVQPRRHHLLVQRPCGHGVEAALFGLDIAPAMVELSAFELVGNASRKTRAIDYRNSAAQCMRPRATQFTALAARLPLIASKRGISAL